MKLVSRVAFALMMLPCIASAFSLDSIRSIECVDRYVTPGVSVYFTTSDSAAHQYTRRPGAIPYDYANKQSPYRDAQSGEMTLANNPDVQGGVIVLLDNYNPRMASSLVLRPAGQPGFYVGTLSGNLEFEKGWQPVSNYPLNCVIK